MQHIDELTLELYVINAPEVLESRGEIEEHLTVCVGCTELAASMRSFYKEAQEAFDKAPRLDDKLKSSVARMRRAPKPIREMFTRPPATRPVTGVQRFRYFVRAHPVIAIGGGVAGAACVAALIMVGVSTFKGDTNPTSYFFNNREGTIQVYNKENQLLWQRRSTDVPLDPDVVHLQRHIEIVDLDGDGRNEVLTSMSLNEDFGVSTLKAVDGAGTILWEHLLSYPFQYLERNYSSEFNATSFVTGYFDRSGEIRMLVAACNWRSPSRIISMDNNRRETDSYWHQGHLEIYGTFDLDGDGQQEVIAGGVNDVNDTTMGEFPVLVVLKPGAIVGQGKSTACPGFEFPFSSAELFYLRFPIPDIHASNMAPVTKVEIQKDGTMWVYPRTNEDNKSIGLSYILDRSMQVKEVRSNNTTDRFHAELKKQGKVTSSLDRAYLEEVRRGVRYWDGEKWQDEQARVKSGETLASNAKRVELLSTLPATNVNLPQF